MGSAPVHSEAIEQIMSIHRVLCKLDAQKMVDSGGREAI